MKIRFKINYKTDWGQSLAIHSTLFGSDNELGILKMTPVADHNWEVILETASTEFTYQYVLINDSGKVLIKEFGTPRKLILDGEGHSVYVNDFWRANDHLENSLYTSPFSKSIFKRATVTTKRSQVGSSNFTLQLRAPRVGTNYAIGVLGNHPKLGDWEESKVVVLSDANYPIWETSFSLDIRGHEIAFKFVIYSLEEQRIVTWEAGENRFFSRNNYESPADKVILTEEHFRYPVGRWKSAGVAIPVFSLRSQEGCGVGEFTDLKKLVDWSCKTGLRVVQILPVNDTVASHTWVDSYPYAAISVHALHPIYANLKSIGLLKDKKLQKTIDLEAERLNKLETLDYESVMKLKSKYFKYNFDENIQNILNSKELNDFIRLNENWVIAYAVFSYLRDKFKTVDFTKWGKYAKLTQQELIKLASPDQPHYGDIAIHYYIQYHLDKQLKEATAYARERGVVLKGDIPIGIFRNSVDAWMFPELFNMETQAGAPPDDFSVTGQNWGFPTYNWEEMAKDNYAWWRDRMIKMSEYFDVFRIDHILGFFRIWEVPWEGVEGTLGRFNPSLPLTENELKDWGIPFDFDRYCTPYIHEYMLHEMFGKDMHEVTNTYLNPLQSSDRYELKSDFNTQRKIKHYFDDLIKTNPEKIEHHDWLKTSLYRLVEEVLFLTSEIDGVRYFSPRISLHSTYTYRALDPIVQHHISNLYNHFYYHRHNQFWRESAMRKLPMLKDATDMLICGEDLGMVPASVPGVMDELQILSLAIQRMPSDDREFWHPSDTKYLSVTSTSSHDVSTLRGWWLEDRVQTQRFFNNILGESGVAPEDCDSGVVKAVIAQHLRSPSMFAIFPIQDILAMNDRLKREDVAAERINIPKIINYYWKYRFHLNLEDLLEEDDFNRELRDMINDNGRLADY